MLPFNRLGVVAALLVATAACRDSAPPDAVAAPIVASLDQNVAPSAVRTKSRVTPAEFHARNKMDWVGIEHNRLMDELRSDIRLRRPRDLCKAVQRIGIDVAFDPKTEVGLSAPDARKLRRAAFEAVGCKGQRFGVQHTAARATDLPPGPFTAAAAIGEGDFEMSPDAWVLVDRISAAGGDSPDPTTLASELAGIVADAQALSADEQTVIDAAASVALSSYEYWSQNADAMAQEMSNAYGDCVENGGGQSCFYAVADKAPMRLPRPTVQMASYSRGAVACEINRGFIWSGDKWGVGVGLATGLMTRSVQGVVVGIIAGAAAGSAGAATWEFGRYVWCAFHT